MVFAIIAIVTTVGYVTFSLNVLNSFDQSVLARNQLILDANKENFNIQNAVVTNNKFDIIISNSGNLAINITRMWVQNTTATDWVNFYPINQLVSPGSSLIHVGQNVPVSVVTTLPAVKYNIKFITSRGNTLQFNMLGTSTGQQTLQDPEINGMGLANVVKTTPYIATAFDTVINVNVTACGNPCQVTLPSASKVTNETYWVKKVDFGRNILSIKGGGSIDGNLFYNMTFAKQSTQLQSNGTGWNVLEATNYDVNSFKFKGAGANRWYSSETEQFTNATFTPTANILYAVQYTLSQPATLDQIRIGVTATGAGSLCRIGIYSDNGTMYPNTLVSGSDVGTIDTSTLGIKTNTFATAKSIGAGLYWLALDCQATVPSLAGIPLGSFNSVLGESVTRMGGQQIGQGWQIALTFGALPSQFPSAGTVQTTVMPLIDVRHKG
jgi:hypothetical protein